MGAITVVVLRREMVGYSSLVVGTMAMSASYAANGDTFTLANLGLETLDTLIIGSSEGYLLAADVANLKIKAFESGADGSPNDEATAVDDLDALSVIGNFIAFGRGMAARIG